MGRRHKVWAGKPVEAGPNRSRYYNIIVYIYIVCVVRIYTHRENTHSGELSSGKQNKTKQKKRATTCRGPPRFLVCVCVYKATRHSSPFGQREKKEGKNK